jgi:hypothetical protein
MMGLMVSPLLGSKGNVEFLAHLVAGGAGAGPALVDLDAAVAAAVAVRRAEKEA